MADGRRVVKQLVDGGGAQPTIEDLEMIESDQAGVRDAAGSAEPGEFFAEGDDVISQSHRFKRRVQAVGEPAILGGHAGRAVAGMAALGLNTADGQHRFAGNGNHIAAEAEGEERPFRKA